MAITASARFVGGFTLVHTAAYFVAGVVELLVADRLYRGEQRRVDFVRDVTLPEEAGRINRVLLPAQAVRGVLMAVVLLPLLGPIGDLSVGVRAAFFGGLMFVYADLASAIPFPNTVEGLVYLEPEYVDRGTFLAVQFEAILYSALFGLAAAWLLF